MQCIGIPVSYTSHVVLMRESDFKPEIDILLFHFGLKMDLCMCVYVR